MTLRVDLRSLPEDVQESIEAGEPVEFERDGRLIGAFQRAGERDTWAAYIERRKAHEPLDADAFERDIADGLSVLRPQPYAWE